MKTGFIILFVLFGINVYAVNKPKPEVRFNVSHLSHLPGIHQEQVNPGVAGAFSGIANDKLIVAGGANFPDKKPWEGGIKTFHEQIYVYDLTADTLVFRNEFFDLPFPVAYGSSVTLPGGILCIGGNDSDKCFSKVFLILWNESHHAISFEDYPDLPIPLSYASAVKIGDVVYVVGGSSLQDGRDTGNHFFCLDLSKKNSTGFGWESLPAYPGAGRIFPVVVAQSNGTRPCIFLFSGRNVGHDKKITVFKDGFLYDPVLEQWTPIITDDSTDFPVMAGTAFPVGASNIVFIGGAKGDLLVKEQQLREQFSEVIKLRDTSAIALYKEKRLQYYTEHPGFSKDILLYNTITNTIIPAGKFDTLCPVTTKIIPWKDGAILTSGEIKPGVRTSEIFSIMPVKQSFSFGWLNSSVLFIYFFVLLIIGYLFSRKQKSTDDYFKGGGRVPWWAAGLSLFGTALSAITFMAIPAKTYATDWSYFAFNMSIFLVAPVIIILFIPFYRRLDVTTAYEYLEKRYNLTIRLLGSISFIFFQIGRMGVVLLLPSLALNVVTGMDVFLCIILMGIISLVYTLMGGIEAVIWTDVIQVIVLLFGAVVALFIMSGVIDGGLPAIYETAVSAHKFNLLDLRMTLREPTVWVMLIGGMFTNITTYGTDQTMVQRYLTTQTERKARQSVWTNAWLTIPATILFFSIGTALFVFYRNYPELNNPALENTDSIFPWFITTELPEGLSGLLIAGIFAAAMSSLSSSMNSAATAYSTDIHFRFGLTSKISQLKIARITTFIIGLSGTLFALFMATWNIQSLWDEFNKLIGLLIGSLGGLFLLGILTRRANVKGAIIGIAVSILVQIVVSNSHSVHLLMYTATGVVSCFVFGWLGSLFFSQKNENIDGLTIWKSK